MKTITKTFYVSFVGNLNEENHNAFNLVLKSEKTELFNKQVQISWQEPGRKIEITESEFDEICRNYKLNGEDCEKHPLIIAIKNDIFGASDE